MESIMYRDPEHEASFSFNSTLHVFSDDDECGFNDDEYIEIALEQQPLPEELDLELSFGLGSEWETATATTTPASSSSSTSTLSFCSSGETFSAVNIVQPSTMTHKTVKRRVHIRAVLNRLLNGFLSTPTTPSAEMRKATKGGMMMKFLIKCRSINIRAVLASFVKSYQITISSPQSKEKMKKKKKPFDKLLGQREKPNHEDIKINCCPSSRSHSLPIQQGDSCSIQAAIAYCKRSFGNTSEFHF